MKEIVLKHNSIVRGDPDYLQTYLAQFGVTKENAPHFIGIPPLTDEDNPKRLKNMAEAVDLFFQMYQKNPHMTIYVQPDSDTDGYTSSAIIISYLKRFYPSLTIKWQLHEGKEHGIDLSFIDDDVNLVIIPDAGTENFKEQLMLAERGVPVIILDHHAVDSLSEEINSKPIYIVNNQLSPDFDNKSLSGAGMAYLFIKALAEVQQSVDYIDYRDLAAVGIIGDNMNMLTLGNNFLAYFGLNHICNPFLKALITKQARGIKDPEHLTKIDVMFYIAPVINGVIRGGTMEDKKAVFTAMITPVTANPEPIVTTYRGTVRVETIYEYAVRLASNAKSRQDNNKKKATELLKHYIEEKQLDKHNVLLVPLTPEMTTKINTNLTGLIAMELVKAYDKPTMVLRQNTEGWAGSARNGTYYTLPDLRHFVLESNCAYYARGHANAFGVSFADEEHIQQFLNYADTYLDAEDFNKQVYEVDYWFKSNETVDIEMLMTFAQNAKLWGTGIPAPLFAFDVYFDSHDVMYMGAEKTSIKILAGDIDYVAFTNPELASQLKTIATGKMTIIGTVSINEWMGRKSLQVQIKDYELNDVNAEQCWEDLL